MGDEKQNATGFAQTIVETTRNAAGQLLKRITYTFGADEVAQTKTEYDPITGSETNSETLTFGHDGHGSVSVLVDAAQAIVQAFHYAAFGELLSIHNSTGSPIGVVGSGDLESQALTNLLYSGEAFDTRISLQYLRARNVDLRTGRFASHDPYSGDASSPFSFNKYAYTSGDPIRYGDPTGQFEGLIEMLGSLSIGQKNNAASGAASAQALNTAHRAIKLIEWIHYFVDAYFTSGGDMTKMAIKLIGLDLSEIKQISKDILRTGLS